MKKIKRSIHIDFHTMPNIENFGETFNAKEFAEILSDAHVQSVNMFARGNQGFAFFDTKVGTKYPGLKDNRLGDIVKECHAKGIGVVGYMNITHAQEQTRKHPEWCRIDEKGHIIDETRRDQAHFMTMCYNSPGYRQHMREFLTEVVALGVDGIYFDCIYPRPCYCNHCVEEMQKEGINIKDVAAVTDFTYRKILEFAAEIRSYIPKELNIIFSGIATEYSVGMQYRCEIEHLPSCWGYEQVPASAAYQRNVFGKDNVQYMTGRFQKGWGDFGGFKGRISLENDMYDALYTNMGFCIGDHMHPARNIDKNLYKIFGEVFEKYMQYEKWTEDTDIVAEVAILKNKYTAYSDNLGVKDNEEHLCVNAAVRMLGELKQSFDVINEDMDFGRYKIIILPDRITMTDKLKDKLDAYIKNGGKIISTGESGLNKDKTDFALDAWNFVKFDGLDASVDGYFKADESINELPFEWNSYREGIAMTATDKKYEVSAFVKPYFDVDYDGLFGYGRYNPPKEETGQAVMAMSDNVCQISFKVFSAYGRYFLPPHKGLVKYALDKFLADPIIKTDDMPATSRISVAAAKDYDLLHIKATFPEHRGSIGIVEQHGELVAGHTISVKGEYKAASLLPNETPVEFKVENGYTTVTLPAVTGYAMIKLDK